MLAIDAVWLNIMAKRFYTPFIGKIMAESPNLIAAGVFYVLYIGCLTFLVLLPSLQMDRTLALTFLYGAVFGLAAYATYDLTNQATLIVWSTWVTIVDILWGMLLTGTISVVAVSVVRYFSAS